jgi:hypothetical protein
VQAVAGMMLTAERLCKRKMRKEKKENEMKGNSMNRHQQLLHFRRIMQGLADQSLDCPYA